MLKKMSKLLCGCLAVFMLVGCAATEVTSEATVAPEQTLLTTREVANLLEKIAASPNRVEKQPALVHNASLVRQGCRLTIDRLDFWERPCGDIEIVNREESTEELTISSVPLYSKTVSATFIGQDYINYIKEKEEPVRLMFYVLDGEVLFVSEISE